MPLTDTQIRNLKPGPKPRKVSDGGGLHLLVTDGGSKLWRLAYRYEGKQKLLSFGSYPAVSLSEARVRREEAKGLLADGVDPSVKAKLEKIERKAQATNTFGVIAQEFLDKNEKEGLSQNTLKKKRWMLETANRFIGNRPIKEIAASEILVPLREQEAKGNYETARRLRATIGQVFRYAIATARADNDPTFGLRGALIAPKVIHRAAIIERKPFAQLVRAIWGYEGSAETKAILKLMCLLYPRPGELRMSH
ncbi:MAG: tyrosine-type recombinase/integrase, partial [Rhizobiaceae bacterium]